MPKLIASATRLALFLPLVLGVALLFLPRGGHSDAVAPTGVATEAASEAMTPEKLLFLLQYIGTDYEAAVAPGGRIASEVEYREMLDFSRTLLDEYRRRVGAAPTEAEAAVLAELEDLAEAIRARRDPDEILRRTRRIAPALTRTLAITAYPRRTPDLANGERLYRTACERCHGPLGDGRGPAAADLDPPPSSFRDERMNRIPPHQLFNAIGFGVEGTAMPSFHDALDEDERWDLAFYLMTLRESFAPAPASSFEPSLRDLATFSNEELLGRARTEEGPSVGPADVDHARAQPPEQGELALLRQARAELEASFRAWEAGRVDEAVRRSLSAYLEGIEPVEPALATTDAAIVRRIEEALAAYRAALRGGASPERVGESAERLRRLLDEAEGALATSGSDWGLAFFQSLAIILREGIEAALLLALMLGSLQALGHHEMKRHCYRGAAAGLGAGVVTWIAARTVLEVTPLAQEALEGIVSLLAAAVLFSVSFWILHRIDLEHWKRFLETKAQHALGRGSGLALASVAFLAVYREAFETVLFYQALWVRAKGLEGAVVGGLVAGAAVLAALVVGMFRFGLRIPLKPFFAVTGVLLAVLSIVFAGYGVTALQRIGWIKETPVAWLPTVSWLELRPTLEAFGLQLGLLASFLLAWFGSLRGRWLGRASQATS